MKTKTISGRATPKRDNHVARGARILTTGISIASVLGLTSAYAIAAPRSTSASGNGPVATAQESSQTASPTAATSATSPTQPGPAIPVNSAASAVPTTLPDAKTKANPQVKLKVRNHKLSATHSSGSK